VEPEARQSGRGTDRDPGCVGRDRLAANHALQRTALALFVVAWVFLNGTAIAWADPPWATPHALVVQLEGADFASVNRTFRRNGTGGPIDGPIQPGQIVGFASLETLRATGPTLAPGTRVMYDLERWGFSPLREQAAPFRSMRQFVSAARSFGLVPVLAPGGFYRDRAANLDADAFLAQVQNIMDPARYRAKVCEIAEGFDGPVIAELAANGKPGHTARGLYRQWRAGKACTSRFALWGKDAPAPLAVAQEFLRLVAVSVADPT
jgi:hypothetical protein